MSHAAWCFVFGLLFRLSASFLMLKFFSCRSMTCVAAGEGHDKVVQILCEAGADVNCEDRWKRRPLDDARDAGKENCCKILISFGAAPSPPSRQTSAVGDSQPLDGSTRRQFDNLKINFKELEMIDRIGAGAFGEIYKCR
jgi:hypothetical protein